MAAFILLALLAGQNVRAIMDRAVADFRTGRVAASLSGFDRVAALSPADAPYLWQRGIAQCYIGRRHGSVRAVLRAALHRPLSGSER